MSDARIRRGIAIVAGVLLLMFLSALQATEGTHYTKVTNALGFAWLSVSFALLILSLLPERNS